jgi:hypothetical protein
MLQKRRLVRSDIEVITDPIETEGDRSMGRYKFCLAVVAGMVLVAKGAAAQGAWYISGSAGAVLPSDYSRSVTITNFDTGRSGPGTDKTTYTPGEASMPHWVIGYRWDSGSKASWATSII